MPQPHVSNMPHTYRNACFENVNKLEFRKVELCESRRIKSKMLLNRTGFIRNLKQIASLRSFSVRSASQNRPDSSFDGTPIDENEAVDQQSSKLVHPFNSMYPWQTLEEFVENLEKRVIFNDKKLIAIDKPWGVAYHKANKTLYKPYSFETLSLIPGEPRFCMNDALPLLEERLELDKLEYVKTIDRYSSGVILLCTNPRSKARIRRCINRSKTDRVPLYSFQCIAQGFPAIQGNELSEKIRIKLRDLDELADYKEPIIVPEKFHRKEQDRGYLTRVSLKINSINKLNSASYLNVCTNQLRWNFVRCYVAHKAAFVIGDLRFSANIKRILGETVLETTNSFYKNNRIEPMNRSMLRALKVRSNRKVPLMLHLDSIYLERYTGGKDLVIKTARLPDHFQFALDRLGLENQS